MATMKDIIQSPLLLALVIGGLLYFKICAIFNGSKVTGGQHFIILT